MGNARYKKLHKDNGLCVDCPENVHPGHVRCLRHLRSGAASRKRSYRKYIEKEIKYSRQLKKERKKNGRCPMCGAPAKGELITCQNCRERVLFVRVENAAIIVENA